MISENTIEDLKLAIQESTGVNRANQKLFLKGKTLRDDMSVSALGLTSASRLMLIGSKQSDIDQATANVPARYEERNKYIGKIQLPAEPLSVNMVRILQKGPPDDAIRPNNG